MTQRRHRQLDTLSDRLHRAATLVPNVYDHLDEQRAHTPAIAAHPTDTIGNTGDISNPTLNTVQALDAIEQHRRTIKDAIATLGVCVDMLDDACRTALGVRRAGLTEESPDKPLCINDVQLPDGTWTRCTRNVEHYRRPDGSLGYRDLCPTCRKRGHPAA